MGERDTVTETEVGDAAAQVPVTGNNAVDAVMAGLGDLPQLSVADGVEKLSQAQTQLQEILNGSRDGGPAPMNMSQ